MQLRIGNGAGFLGDNLDAPRQLAEAGQLDYLTLEYLAELTLSILARVREKNPAAGFASDFLPVLASLHPALKQQPKLGIVTNAGGMNPPACARAAAAALVAAELGRVPVAVVTGDDLLPRLTELQAAGCRFEHLDTGAPLSELGAPVVSANAYLGARPLVEALSQEARIVITGRVADASLTLAPAVHRFGWSWTDWPRLAAASVAGHLIECGAQCTGGFSTHWSELALGNVGYPIAELAQDGSCVITKPPGTGGRVDRATVAEQLVYEIGDPARYLTPDVAVDFTRVTLEEIGPDRVRVLGAQGQPAPETLKVSLAYRAGFTAAGQLVVYGREAVAKARACAEAVWQKLAAAGCRFEQQNVELLGAGEGVPGGPVRSPAPGDQGGPSEVVLRMAVRDPRREVVERFTRELAPLITAGPAGLAGYAAGRPEVRAVFAYWPTLVPRELVPARVLVRSAAEWAADTGAN